MSEIWVDAAKAKEWPEGFKIIVEETWHTDDQEIADPDEGYRTLFYSEKSNKCIDRAEKQGPDFTFRYALESSFYGDDSPASLPALQAEVEAFRKFRTDLYEFGRYGLNGANQDRRLKFYELLAVHGLLPGTASWNYPLTPTATGGKP